jgi:signal transduction histidine kinase/ligand-binding sensor domain-containing protein
MTLPVPAWLLVFLLIATHARGSIRPTGAVPVSEDYVLRVWDLKDGLGDSHVGSIGRDRDGYLWITNFDGLIRFDGSRMENAKNGIVARMPTDRPAPVLIAKDDSIWFGFERGGLGRIRGGVVDTIFPAAPLPSPAWWPSDLEEGDNGDIWMGTNDKAQVTRIQAGAASVFGVGEGLPAGKETRVRTTTSGVVWVATTGGCAVFDGQGFREIDPDAGGALRPVLAPSSSGGMWTSRGGKVLRYDADGNRLETLGPAWFQDVSQINALLEDAVGTLWIGTLDSGLFCYKQGRFERVPTSFSDIYCLLEDGDGNLWCGTWGGGLNRISPRRFFLRQVQSGAPGEVIRSILEDSEKRLWAVGRFGRIVRSESPGDRSFLPVPLPSSELRTAAFLPALGSGIWLGTNQGLMLWNHGQVSPTPIKEPILALFSEASGAVWVGTESGPLLRYMDGRVETFDTVQAARAMALDQQGRLWVGTDHGGLFMQHADRFEAVPLPGAQPNQTVRIIEPDGSDTLWIGALQGGLYRHQKGRTQKVPESPKGALRELRCLLIERQLGPEGSKTVRPSPDDVFWIGTATGLLRSTRGAIDEALNGESGKMDLLVIGANEGIPNAEFSMGFQKGAIQASDGRLLFGTTLGLLEVPANAMPKRPPSGRVVVEEAISRDVALYAPTHGPWVFPPNPDVIRIRYTLPELSTPEQVRFRYRLDRSADEERWVDVGHQREITLAQPSPGSFRVEISAAIGDGPWLPSPATADFVVQATWWETSLFRWSVVLLSIGLIAGIARGVEMQRMRSRIRRLEQEHAIERERARIARDMHDEVGANLTHIATTTRLASLDSPSAVGEHLREIETAARHTVESLDEIVWAVNPRNDTVAKTVEYICKFAAAFLTKTGVQPEVSAPAIIPELRLPAEARHHLFLAVKEAINNIVKHSRARSAKIHVEVGANRLLVIVQDDGKGFEAGTAETFSNGLINMRERMSAVGGRCIIESRPRVPGSQITFELPLTDT